MDGRGRASDVDGRDRRGRRGRTWTNGGSQKCSKNKAGRTWTDVDGRARTGHDVARRGQMWTGQDGWLVEVILDSHDDSTDSVSKAPAMGNGRSENTRGRSGGWVAQQAAASGEPVPRREAMPPIHPEGCGPNPRRAHNHNQDHITGCRHAGICSNS